MYCQHERHTIFHRMVEEGVPDRLHGPCRQEVFSLRFVNVSHPEDQHPRIDSHVQVEWHGPISVGSDWLGFRRPGGIRLGPWSGFRCRPFLCQGTRQGPQLKTILRHSHAPVALTITEVRADGFETCSPASFATNPGIKPLR